MTKFVSLHEWMDVSYQVTFQNEIELEKIVTILLHCFYLYLSICDHFLLSQFDQKLTLNTTQVCFLYLGL